MNYDQKTKQTARQLYIDGLTLNDIAKSLSINPKTVSAWKQDDKKHNMDWDKLRTVHNQSNIEHLSMILLDELTGVVGDTFAKLKNSDANPFEKIDSLAKLLDSFNKGVTGCQKLMPEVNENRAVLFVLSKFNEHIANKYPHFLQEFANISESFIEELE